MSMTAPTAIAGAFLAASLSVASAARAASPALETVLPRGAQRGTEVEVVFKGARLNDAKEVFVYGRDITVQSVETVSPAEVKAKLTIAPDARLGEHAVRVRTGTGITELRNFYVGPFPVVAEAAEVRDPSRPRDPKAGPVPPEKQPTTFERPQKIDLNVTVGGVTEFEQVDYYQVECKKGQRLTVEVEATRLGSPGQAGQGALDPAVLITDTGKAEVASSDDTPLLRQDCVASAVIPHDGPYIIRVRDSAYGGGPRSYYRMHVGTFPRPTAVYPAGGRAGEEVTVQFIGDPAGPFGKTVKLPADPNEPFALVAEQDGLSAPSANAFRVSPLPNVLEAEPNDDPKSVSAAATADAPAAFNGIIGQPGDADAFRFKAAKGQVLDINVYARRVRSRLDPVLTVLNARGNQVNANDDAGGPDSYLRFNVPADGEYFVAVRDHLKRGGPDFVYRIEVAPVQPKLALSIPNAGLVGQPSQERQTIVIPRGNRFGTLIRATRADAAGDFVLHADGLPEGVRMIAPPVAAGQDAVPVIFEAAADAPVAGKLCDLVAQPAADKEGQAKVEGRFLQTVEMAIGQNNNAYHSVQVGKLAVAVVDELPFTLKVVQPKAPLSQSGAMELKVVAERKGDFKGPINVKMLFDPTGVSAGTATLPPDKAETVIPLSSTAAAAAKKWQIAVLGQADVNGPAWVASQPAELEVVPPFVGAKIVRTKVEQGTAGQVKCEIEQKNPFPGKAKVELLGAPNGVTTSPKEIGPEDKEVVFDVTVDPKAQPGTHATLLCRVTVTKDGEPIVQNLGQGGILRIDPAGTAAKKSPVAGK